MHGNRPLWMTKICERAVNRISLEALIPYTDHLGHSTTSTHFCSSTGYGFRLLSHNRTSLVKATQKLLYIRVKTCWDFCVCTNQLKGYTEIHRTLAGNLKEQCDHSAVCWLISGEITWLHSKLKIMFDWLKPCWDSINQNVWTNKSLDATRSTHHSSYHPWLTSQNITPDSTRSEIAQNQTIPIQWTIQVQHYWLMDNSGYSPRNCKDFIHHSLFTNLCV